MLQDLLTDAIRRKIILLLTFNAKEKGPVTRKCVPFDFGPSARAKDKINRYHFYDLDSPDGHHNLSIREEQIIDMKLTIEHFDPADYVKWTPKWFIERDWGKFS